MTAPEGGGLPVKALAEAVLQSADRLGLPWRLRPATIVQPGPDGAARAVYDGDTGSTRVVSLVGPLPEGVRVMVMITPPAGNHVVGFVGLPPWPLGVIAQVERITSSTPSDGTQGVLRLDEVPVRKGRRYEVRTSSLTLLSTAAGDSGSARISFTTNGTPATTESPLMDVWNSSAITRKGNGTGAQLSVDYVPTADLELSVLLFTSRVSGRGSISLMGSPDRIQLIVEDKGQDGGTAGKKFVL